MPTTFNFLSAAGADNVGNISTSNVDGTISAVIDDGSLVAGDEVTISGFSSDVLNAGGVADGTAFYLGSGTFGSTTGYVFGDAPTVGENTSYFVVFEDNGDAASNQAEVSAYAQDPDSQTLDGGEAFPCFARGSLISTPRGNVPVEQLCIGDLVLTERGQAVPVRWVGRRTACKKFAGSRMQPVRIAAGALGDNLPTADLIVTGCHGMIFGDVSVEAQALVNGGSIDWMPLEDLPDRMTYYHVETELHEVIFANGSQSESFIDVSARQAFDNYDEYIALYGTSSTVREMPHLRVTSPRLLPNDIRVRLDIGNDEEQYCDQSLGKVA